MLKMAFRKSGEESLVGYVREKYNPTDDLSDVDDDVYDDEDAYDNYQPDVDEFDTGEYITFDPIQEERGFMNALASRKSGTVRKPFTWVNSPEKETLTRNPEKLPTWWEKTPTISDSDRVVNGILNYAALLPPPTPKPACASTSKPKRRPKKKSSDAFCSKNGSTRRQFIAPALLYIPRLTRRWKKPPSNLLQPR